MVSVFGGVNESVYIEGVEGSIGFRVGVECANDEFVGRLTLWRF